MYGLCLGIFVRKKTTAFGGILKQNKPNQTTKKPNKKLLRQSFYSFGGQVLKYYVLCFISTGTGLDIMHRLGLLEKICSSLSGDCLFSFVSFLSGIVGNSSYSWEFSLEDAVTMAEVRAARLGFRLERGREEEMRSLCGMLLCLLFIFQWTNILPLLKRSMDTIWSR